MQENKSKKIFGIFNGLDIFIILVLIAAMAFGISWMRESDVHTSNGKTYTYVVEARQVRAETIHFPKEGSNVYESDSGAYLGKIKSVWAQDFCEPMFNRVANRYELLPQPGYSDIYIEIEGTGSEDDQNIRVEGQVVKVGDKLDVKGKGFAVGSYIVEVRDGE